MITSDMMKALLAMKGSSFALIESSDTPSKTLPLTPGQEVRGEVLANLPNGRYLVRVAGERLNMNLPAGIRPGETVQLTYVTSQPRPTFALPQPGNQTVPTTLSETSRWLGLLFRNGAAGESVPASPLPGSPPLLEAGQPDTSALAERLRETLTRSGVFYESHLAEWAEGKGALDALLREPQGRLSARNALHQDVVTEKPAEPSLLPSRLEVGNTASADKPPVSVQSSHVGDLAHEQTVPIIKQQLAALNTGRFIWEGEVWPRQQMEWSVEERDARPGEGEPESWQTTLRLNLPHLGSVWATLHMHNRELSVTVTVDKEDAAAVMRQSEQTLAKGLSGAGVTLTGMVIKHEKPGQKDQEGGGPGL